MPRNLLATDFKYLVVFETFNDEEPIALFFNEEHAQAFINTQKQKKFFHILAASDFIENSALVWEKYYEKED